MYVRPNIMQETTDTKKEERNKDDEFHAEAHKFRDELKLDELCAVASAQRNGVPCRPGKPTVGGIQFHQAAMAGCSQIGGQKLTRQRNTRLQHPRGADFLGRRHLVGPYPHPHALLSARRMCIILCGHPPLPEEALHPPCSRGLLLRPPVRSQQRHGWELCHDGATTGQTLDRRT